MIYELKDCRTGGKAIYDTTVEISEQGGELCFRFVCAHTSHYCPYDGYNKIHAEGDTCEILIGSDPARKTYYELQLNPNGDRMLAKMVNKGVDERGVPMLDIHFVDEKDCFLRGKTTLTEDGGYIAEMRLDKTPVGLEGEKIYFNAYRLETDGGEMDKHLFALNPTMRPKFHAPDYFVLLEDYV